MARPQIGHPRDGSGAKSGDLYDEAKGHPHGGQHVGRQAVSGRHGQRPGREPRGGSGSEPSSDGSVRKNRGERSTR